MKQPTAKTTTILLLGLGMLAAPLASVAQTYQVEAEANLFFVSFDPDNGGDIDGTVIDLNGRYFLEPVETVGPYTESAFLQKSISAGINLTRTGGDFNNDTDFAVDVFYVFPTDLIAGGELSSSDATDIAVFGGKYLDDRTTVIGRISIGDIDSIGAEYKTILKTASGNDLTAEASFALLDAADDGFEIDGSATYFLSNQLGVLGGLGYQDIDDSDTFNVVGGAEYFLSPTLAARGGLSFGFGDSVDTTTVSIGVVGRF